MNIPTPRDLDLKLVTEHEAEVQRVTKLIIDRLEKDWDGNNTVTIWTASMKPRARESLMKSFRLKGWNIEHGSDQREGQYFKVRRGVVSQSHERGDWFEAPDRD